jgi:GNAT superfamily N-acetyltransferase
MNVTIAVEPFDSADAQRLITALDAHLASRYPPEQRFGPNLKPEQVAAGLGTFVVARIDGRAVGCGAVRLLDEGTVEVKRMYVEPDVRGQGVAREILAHLEGAGRERARGVRSSRRASTRMRRSPCTSGRDIARSIAGANI